MAKETVELVQILVKKVDDVWSMVKEIQKQCDTLEKKIETSVKATDDAATAAAGTLQKMETTMKKISADQAMSLNELKQIIANHPEEMDAMKDIFKELGVIEDKLKN